MYRKILIPFLVLALVLGTSFGLLGSKKAEAAFVSFSAADLNNDGDAPWGLDVGDFDGDTNLDFVTSSINDNTVSVFFGDGAGNFSVPDTYAVGAQPRAVTAYDVDGDTFPDLIASNRNGNTITVLLNDGDGTFTDTGSPVSAVSPRYTAFGDLNGDTFADMVIAISGNPTATSIGVTLGAGDGTFGAVTTYSAGGSASPAAVTTFVGLHDVDNDTELDIVSTNELNNSIGVLLGNGDGTFGAVDNYSTGGNPRAVDFADFNGDTFADLAVARSGNGVVIYINDGDGTFTAGASYLSGNAISQIDIDDFNGDGEFDLAVSNESFDTVSILTGVGDGTFNTADQFSTGGLNPRNIKAADFNDDTFIDIIAANIDSDTIAFLANDPTQKDITAFSFPEGTGVIVGTDITVDVPESTDVTSLTPTITHTGVSVSPASGVAQDFSSPVVYTVTALDASTKDYTVTVNLVPVDINIVSPSNGETLQVAIPLVALTDDNVSCDYEVDGGGTVPFNETGGQTHTTSVVGVTPGSHTIEVTCGGAGSDSITITKLDPGSIVLYAVDGLSGGSNNLHIVDPETGEFTSTIGPVGHEISALAMDPTSGILYGTTLSSDVGGSPNSLFSINTTTGAALLLGTVTSNCDGGCLSLGDQGLIDITFNSAGVLYGWSEVDDAIYSVDVASCTGTLCNSAEVGNSGVGSYGTIGLGLAFDSNDVLRSTPLGEDYLIEHNPSDASISGFSPITNPSGSSFAVGGITYGSLDLLFGMRRNFGSSPAELISFTDAGPYIVPMGDDSDNPDLLYVSAIAFSVDTDAPTVDIDLDDYDLNDGDTALVTFTFSEPVIGFTNSDITVENGVLTSVASLDGGTTWTATFTPTDDIEEPVNNISVNMTGVFDLGLNPGVGTAGSLPYSIDTLAPATPVESPAAASYSTAQSVTLSSAGSDSIRYTIDGTTPSCSVGTVYSTPISVSSTTTINAIGCDTAGNTPASASFVYTISGSTSGGGGRNTSGGGYLPVTKPEAILNSGECPSDQIITQNLRQGARDGSYEWYERGVVTQVKLLQSHINRILATQYQQAAGPVDGIFGPLTKQGVQRLQAQLNTTLKPLPLLVIDGIVGPFTKAAINNSCGIR